MADELPPAAILGMLQVERSRDQNERRASEEGGQERRTRQSAPAQAAPATTGAGTSALRRGLPASQASAMIRVSWQQESEFGSGAKAADDRDRSRLCRTVEWVIAAAISSPLRPLPSRAIGGCIRFFVPANGSCVHRVLLFIVLGAAAGWMNLLAGVGLLTEPLGQFNDFSQGADFNGRLRC